MFAMPPEVLTRRQNSHASKHKWPSDQCRFALRPRGRSASSTVDHSWSSSRNPQLSPPNASRRLCSRCDHQHHAELRGRVALTDRRVIELARAIRNAPERPRRDAREILFVDTPQKQRTERPAAKEGINEQRNLSRSPHVRPLQIRLPAVSLPARSSPPSGSRCRGSAPSS